MEEINVNELIVLFFLNGVLLEEQPYIACNNVTIIIIIVLSL